MFSFIQGFTTKAILITVVTISGSIQFFLGKLLATIAQWLGYFLKFQGNYFENITIVQESWKIFRDFSNMFFILILIIIAFATILDLQNYNWKGLMAKFMIAALLINFSMAIGGFLIKVSTTLSNVALNQFTDITANLAAGFGINQFITATPIAGTSPDASMDLLLATYLSTTGTIIMTVIILCAFVSAFAFSIARIPVLWALLIVSPIAWICYIMPQTRKVWDMWWDWFLCWTFFMPAYLFSLVIGIGILNNRPDIAAANTATSFFGFGVQEIFFYVLTVIIMVGSLAFGMKMACAAGTGAVATFGAISGRVNKFAKENTYYNSLKKGLLGKAAEIQDTGFKSKLGGALYGGERAERLREAKVAEIFGQKGALSETEAGEVKKSYERRKAENLTKDELNALNTQAVAGKFNKFEMLALRQLRAENGWVASGPAGVTEIKDTIRKAGENSKFAREYLTALEKNGFAEALGSIEEAENLAGNAEFASLERSVLKTMAKNNQIRKKDLIKNTLDIFATESREARDSIEKDLEKNIKNIEGLRTKEDRGKFILDENEDKEIRRIAAGYMASEGEAADYKQYKAAVDLLGGENEDKSQELLRKIAKDSPVLHAEVVSRQKIAKFNSNAAKADYDLTDAEMVVYQQELEKKFDKMDASDINKIDKKKWESPAFQNALFNRIETLEALEPTKPPEEVIDEKTGKPKMKNQKQKMKRVMDLTKGEPVMKRVMDPRTGQPARGRFGEEMWEPERNADGTIIRTGKEVWEPERDPDGNIIMTGGEPVMTREKPGRGKRTLQAIRKGAGADSIKSKIIDDVEEKFYEKPEKGRGKPGSGEDKS